MEEGESSPILLVTAGYDRTIRFWDALSGLCYKTLQHPESQVNSLAISPDKKFVIAAGNPKIALYDVESANTQAVITNNLNNRVKSVRGTYRECNLDRISKGWQMDLFVQ
jgi:WD40 repeat protein